MRNRNTPAYAGKTEAGHAGLCEQQKHPRVCGEDPQPQTQGPRGGETPPRMRGRLFNIAEAHILPGNTPAYAGKTAIDEITGAVSEKHPRVCGEDFRGRVYAMGGKETPPRMRGRPAGAVFRRVP